MRHERHLRQSWISMPDVQVKFSKNRKVIEKQHVDYRRVVQTIYRNNYNGNDAYILCYISSDLFHEFCAKWDVATVGKENHFNELV